MPGSSPPQSPAAVLSNINQVPQHHVTPPCLSCRSEPVGPVAYLHQRGIQVLVKETSLAPHFFFAYTNPAYDVDVSAQMHHAGMVEKAISHVRWHKCYHEKQWYYMHNGLGSGQLLSIYCDNWGLQISGRDDKVSLSAH